jgi:hypothetical protein
MLFSMDLTGWRSDRRGMTKFIQGIFLLTAFSASANAASFVVSNVTNGLSDTVYTEDGKLMTSGFVTIGYFNAGFDVDAAAGTNNFSALIQNFVVVNSAQIGGLSPSLNGSFAGYAESGTSVNLGTIGAGNPLLGRDIYSLLGDSSSASTFNSTTLLGLLKVGIILNDDVQPQTYSSNPQGATILLGSTGTISGNLAGVGEGTHPTVDISFPEASSSAILGVFGLLGLLARRRA